MIIFMEALRLSVRTVVEFVLICGDIDSRYVDSSVMHEGIKAHKKIQDSGGENYRKEVSLKCETELGSTPVILQGRADGIITEPDGVVIDEIKSTTLPLEQLYGQRELHLGQAKCYAYMLIKNPDGFGMIDQITIQLTYIRIGTEEIQRHRFTYTAQEIEAFFSDLMDRYSAWLEYKRDWKETRDKSIKFTEFPYPYRKGQRKLAVAVYRTIQKSRKLYVQAPTGIGKTLSTLFPSIKAIGEGEADKLFYLTAKTVTRTVAEDAVSILTEKGLRFKSVTLRAKNKICFMEETICNPDYCPYAKGHYDRINNAVMDILGKHDIITPSIIEQFAGEHMVCPHEMALDAALWADLVICDYNHVFDPTVFLKRFFAEVTEDYVFLIDEAHNLADRVRDMYTESVGKTDIYRFKRALKDKNKTAAKLRKSLTAVNDHLLDLRREIEGEKGTFRVREEQSVSLTGLVRRLSESLDEWLAREQHNAHPLQKEALEMYFNALAFSGISEIYDERYCEITEISGSNVSVTLFCLDPSAVIAYCLKRAKATVIFSATLSPLPYYRDILGGTEEDGMLALESPFDPERLLLVADGGISTKYANRPASYKPIAEMIREAVAGKRDGRGNFIVYFPSYDYMKTVHGIFADKYPEIETIVQYGMMDELEREKFLLRFDENNPGSLVGFCVLGGIFSEGVDLKGERLIGSIIVGVGLPGISLRQDLIRDYYEEQRGAGYDYAYVYPGMNKVLQAAGRVIRSEEDYGLVLLIDERFHLRKYLNLYPSFWSEMKFIYTPEELSRLITDFPYLSS